MPTHYKGQPETVQALDTFIKLTRCTDSLYNRLAQRQTKSGLTVSQFGVLETLYHLGPLCQGQISARLLKSTGNITLVLDNLEKRGLVRRERNSEDRRMVTLILTPQGEDLIKRTFPEHAQAIEDELSVLTPAEQVELGRLCKKLGRARQESIVDQS